MSGPRDKSPLGTRGRRPGPPPGVRDEARRPGRVLPFPWDDRPQPLPRSLAEPLTETHREPQILWQSQKMESLGLLAGGVAHDFNNCLLAILGNADLLEGSLTAEAGEAHLLGEIRHAAKRASELCDQLLAFAGQGHHRIEPLDLSALLRGMLRMLKVAVPGRLELRIELADDLPPVAADASQLRQVVMNLVVNAAEAMGDRRGALTVRTAVRGVDACRFDHCIIAPRGTGGSFVCLTVADEGPGMDPLTVSRAFDPFYSTKPRGRGLGLASVLGIVRSHRGGVAVDTGPGRGTAVTVMLPRREETTARVAPRVASAAADLPRAGSVLVVDDEEYLRVLAARMVTRLGYRVHLAADADEALAICREHGDELDCVILDLVMPGRDGEEVFADLREGYPDLPVLLTSGYHESEISRRFEGRGLAGFLQKPYVLEDLARKLDRVLDPRRET